MATLAPPMEQFHEPPQEVPPVICGVCGVEADTQEYTIILRRPRVTRRWWFCSLEHLRIWAAPVH